MNDLLQRIHDLYQSLSGSWSSETGSEWLPENPASGQGAVTALVAQDALGGEILKTEVSEGGWHFYNLIEGRRWDFTATQFATSIVYEDRPSSRDEALADTSPEQYQLLRDRVIGDAPSQER